MSENVSKILLRKEKRNPISENECTKNSEKDAARRKNGINIPARRVVVPKSLPGTDDVRNTRGTSPADFTLLWTCYLTIRRLSVMEIHKCSYLHRPSNMKIVINEKS